MKTGEEIRLHDRDQNKFENWLVLSLSPESHQVQGYLFVLMGKAAWLRSQYIFYNNKLITPVICFAELV